MGLKIDRRASRITTATGIVLLTAIIAILLKIFIWERIYYRDKSSETRNPEQAVITDLSEAVNPSEQAPTEEQIKQYQVYTTAPRYLEVPRLAIKARVKDSNVTESVMPVPDNIYDVTWYSGSGNPGMGGNILISGISQGATAPGVFANLDSLEQGDEMTLERGDGERFTYTVKEIQIIDRKDAKNKLPEAQKRIDGKETLALISARRLDENTSDFSSIVIIRATIK